MAVAEQTTNHNGRRNAGIHPTRVRIIHYLGTVKEASPDELSKALAETLGATSYHVRYLAKHGVIVQTRTRRVRGAIQTFYRLDKVRARSEPEQLAALALEAADWIEDAAAQFDDAKTPRKLAQRLRKAAATS